MTVSLTPALSQRARGIWSALCATFTVTLPKQIPPLAFARPSLKPSGYKPHTDRVPCGYKDGSDCFSTGAESAAPRKPEEPGAGAVTRQSKVRRSVMNTIRKSGWIRRITRSLGSVRREQLIEVLANLVWLG